MMSWVVFGWSWALLAQAYDPNAFVLQPDKAPPELAEIGITENLGGRVNLQAPWRADNGGLTSLGQILKSGKPAVLAMVYYECPTLCNLHLNGLVGALKDVDLEPGRDFEVIAVSMNAKEMPELASAKKANYLKAYGKPNTGPGWHFLTGEDSQIQELARAIGFRFRWDEATQQFAHASATIVLTGSGVLSRYLHGVSPDPKTLKLSLVEASQGQIGSIVDQIVMFCFQFDPQRSRYTIYAWNLVRVGFVLTLLVMGLFLVPAWLRERARGA